ncbi:MAG: periplasmic heavy metal sensor [Deltaproteobacteria bacterium]|nr:periplasmic heavy metal sensor [Deltaproteobacteria bacterium]
MVNKLKIIFGISLALNLLLIGMTVGFFFKGCRRPPPHFPPPPELRGTLSPEHERLFSEAMRSLHEKNRDTADKIDATRREILQILTSPRFDATAYQAKTGQLHELHGQMQAQMAQVVMELASQLNAEERQSLAGLLEKGPPPPGGRGPRGGPPPREGPGPEGPPPPPEGRP